jgi:hypothetical protein
VTPGQEKKKEEEEDTGIVTYLLILNQKSDNLVLQMQILLQSEPLPQTRPSSVSFGLHWCNHKKAKILEALNNQCPPHCVLIVVTSVLIT